jgi:hypothetical protein
VGALAGYILADQTLADARTAKQAGPGAGGPHGLFRTAVAHTGVAVLIVAALIPPSTMFHAMGRLQNFEAGGVKLSFVGSGSSLADAIRTASSPRSQSTGNSPLVRSGFVPMRLEAMTELTHPPKVVTGAADEGAFTENSVGFISAELGPPAAPPTIGGAFATTRRVQRDRAMLWELERARVNGEPSSDYRSRLRCLGRAQESFLSLFGQHIACLVGFIDVTKDRRLVDYRNFHLVQELFLIAHTWSKYEKRIALNRLTTTPAPTPPSTAASTGSAFAGQDAPGSGATGGGAAASAGGGSFNQLSKRLQALLTPFSTFNGWINPVTRALAETASASQRARTSLRLARRAARA